MSKRFGWCLDGQHANCRHQYTDWNNNVRVCSCTCHEEEDE